MKKDKDYYRNHEWKSSHTLKRVKGNILTDRLIYVQMNIV